MPFPRNIILALIFAVVSTSCSDDHNDTADTPSEAAAIPVLAKSTPQEDRSNGTALPLGAGGGDVSLQGVVTEPAPDGTAPLLVETIAEGLVYPWGFSFLSDRSIIVTEKIGRIRLIEDGVLLEAPVTGGPDTFVAYHAGYLDILPHPAFEQNKLVYLSYVAGDINANTLNVGRGVLSNGALEGFEVIYESTPPRATDLHFGGKMAWGPDGTLYVTIGEDSKNLAQQADASYGAIIRINDDGSIPDDNPNWGIDTALPELFSKGHRNPHGLAFDQVTGHLYAHEHGPFVGDELNVIEPGGNYGWPVATYGIDYSGDQITPFTEVEGAIDPLFWWSVPVGVAGMTVYRGTEFPQWDGDLLIGGLRDMTLHRLDMEGGEVMGEERYLRERQQKIRDVRVASDGSIFVLTTNENIDDPASNDAANGELLRITREQ